MSKFILALVADTASASACDHLWIGGNDFDAVGNFTWTDGLSFMYTNWDSGKIYPDESQILTPCFRPT